MIGLLIKTEPDNTDVGYKFAASGTCIEVKSLSYLAQNMGGLNKKNGNFKPSHLGYMVLE